MVPDHDGYAMNRDGQAFSSKYGYWIELKPFEHKGYRRITFYKKGKHYSYPVHRIVAQLFIPNPEKKPQVNHIDGNRRNNHVSNLEWCTVQENLRHSREVLGNTTKGTKNPNYGYRRTPFYPSQETRSKLTELGIPRYKHSIVSFGEMLPALIGNKLLICSKIGANWFITYKDDESILQVNGSLAYFERNLESETRGLMLIWLLENHLISVEELGK